VAQCFAVPRAAPELVFESFDEPHQATYAKTVSECWPPPASTASAFARAGDERDSAVVSSFETALKKRLLRMRCQTLMVRSATSRVSNHEATGREYALVD